MQDSLVDNRSEQRHFRPDAVNDCIDSASSIPQAVSFERPQYMGSVAEHAKCGVSRIRGSFLCRELKRSERLLNREVTSDSKYVGG